MFSRRGPGPREALRGTETRGLTGMLGVGLHQAALRSHGQCWQHPVSGVACGCPSVEPSPGRLRFLP